MDKELFDNPIRQHIYTIPCLVKNELEHVLSAVEERLGYINPDEIQTIRMTGCGYSYAACIATKFFIQQATHKNVIVSPAIEESRFSDPIGTSYHNTLFIGISNSGTVSRINEALAYYQKRGAITIGLTAEPKSPISGSSEYLLSTASPSMERPLPLRGYAMTVLNLLAIGIVLSKEHATVGAAKAEYMELQRLMDELESDLARIDEAVFELAQRWQPFPHFEFVGSGYERAAAFLGKIEMMGQAGLMASDEDTEQWLHCNFFMSAPEQIGTMLFAGGNSPALSRSLETMAYMKHLNRVLCIVTDKDTADISDYSVIRMPQFTSASAGIIEMIAPSLLTGYICEMIGEKYSRGFRDQWKIFNDGRGTSQSEIIVM